MSKGHIKETKLSHLHSSISADADFAPVLFVSICRLNPSQRPLLPLIAFDAKGRFDTTHVHCDVAHNARE
eukprot:1678782-Rhodomonas_salina.2